MSAETLWELPVPATAVEDASLKFLARRRHEIAITYRDADDNPGSATLQFKNVVALRCTYLPALTTEMLKGYGKLVDLGASGWLADTLLQPLFAASLRHLLICFDDGPCYEFLCEDYSAADQSN